MNEPLEEVKRKAALWDLLEQLPVGIKLEHISPESKWVLTSYADTKIYCKRSNTCEESLKRFFEQKEHQK